MKILHKFAAGLLALSASGMCLAGQYDGIYQAVGGTDYTIIYHDAAGAFYQINVTLTAVDGTSPNGIWNGTNIGTITGNVATTNIADHIRTQINVWTFNADGSASVTATSCTPAPAFVNDLTVCDMLGTVITVNKLF